MEQMNKTENVILSDIYNAIRTQQAGKGEVELHGVINAFARAMQEGKQCLILFRSEMRNGKERREFAMMGDKAGHKLFPLFTDMTKILPIQMGMEKQGNKMEIGVMGLKELLLMLTSQKMCDGIIVNPFMQNFNAKLEFFSNILRVSPISHITLIQAENANLHTDAIVCPTDASISGKMALDSAIRQAGGEGYETVIEQALQGEAMDVADVTVVQGRDQIHAKNVLFVNVPEHSAQTNTKDLLDSYLNCMNAAKELNCKSITFPCTSAAMKGLPMEAVIGASTTAVTAWMSKNRDYVIDVYFCCEKEAEMAGYHKFFESLQKK